MVWEEEGGEIFVVGVLLGIFGFDVGGVYGGGEIFLIGDIMGWVVEIVEFGLIVYVCFKVGIFEGNFCWFGWRF